MLVIPSHVIIKPRLNFGCILEIPAKRRRTSSEGSSTHTPKKPTTQKAEPPEVEPQPSTSKETPETSNVKTTDKSESEEPKPSTSKEGQSEEKESEEQKEDSENEQEVKESPVSKTGRGTGRRGQVKEKPTWIELVVKSIDMIFGMLPDQSKE